MRQSRQQGRWSEPFSRSESHEGPDRPTCTASSEIGSWMPFSAFFTKWGTSALAASTAVPFPFPTSVFFGAAGASNYGLGRFLTVVTICRAARYGIIAIVADHYGRHFIRALRQPSQYWGWLLLFAAVIFSLIIAGIAVNRRLAATTSA